MTHRKIRVDYAPASASIVCPICRLPQGGVIRVHLSRRSIVRRRIRDYVLFPMKEFLEFIIRQLEEFPDDMVLTEIPSGKMTIFKVQLRQSDVGRIIGRNGQTIHAIRAMLNSSASRHGQRATLEIVE